MILGFQSRFVEGICDQDGRNWLILTPVVYLSKNGNIYIIPRGTSTDGASTPSIIWTKLPPFGDYWQSAVLHDSAYKNQLLVWPAGSMPDGIPITHEMTTTLAKANLSKDDCDNLLKEAMELSGVEQRIIDIIYEGVHLCGASSYKEDRS